MYQLIKTQNNEQGEIIVSGRELHEFLEVKDNYTDWFKRMTKYGFDEGSDFIGFFRESIGGRPSQDHHIKLDMAKEISMIQRTEKGKEARQYFLQVEKAWNSPEMIMKRALEYADAQIQKLTTTNLVLEQQVNELKSKATYYDLILQNKSLISISHIAKDYGMGAPTMNKLLHRLGVQYKQGEIWLLYAKYQDKGYTQTYIHSIDAERSKPHTKWTQQGRLFIYELLKREGIVPTIERDYREVN